MTGFRCSNLRWKCDERGCYTAQLPNWDEDIKCFPRGIQPTDIDGMVEIHGKFLFIEEKGAGVNMGVGQSLAFRRLSQLPGVSVILKRPKDTGLELAVVTGDNAKNWETVTVDEYHDRLRRWADWAQSFPRPE